MDWDAAEREFDHEFLRTETLAEMFDRTVRDRPDETAQEYKGGIYDRSLVPDVLPAAPDGDYAGLTYGEMGDLVRNLAAGFRELGMSPGDRIGIFADTRMEWAHADLAVLAGRGVVTTVYKESSPAQVQYLLGDSGATGVVVENEALADRVFEVEDALDLRFVVVMDRVERHADREDVYSLAEVHDVGADAYDRGSYEDWLAATDVDDLATLVYTSGTTGRPKGVKLTHRNIRSNLNQVFRRYGPRPDKAEDVPTVDADMTVLSYLPLAHIFERHSGHFLQFGLGATVAYAESPDTLTDDLPKVRPTGLINVPRIFERIYSGMREEAAESGLKLRIFEWAMGVAREHYRSDSPGPILRLRHGIADRLVYSTVKEGLGGEIEMLISGGGTLNRDLAELFQGMGLEIFEGYGMTEASPVVTTNPPEDTKPGTVGPPVADLETKVDVTVVPEGQMATTLGDTGELLVAGPNVAEGYWNKPGATDRSFETEDGRRWFRTGDIVTIRPDGYLVFHERNKQLLVLSTGKNVAPQPIEDKLGEHDLVEQSMVVGDDRKFVGALIVPNFDEVRRWGADVGLDLPDDPAALADHNRVRERIRAVVDDVNEHFEAHEQVGEFRLLPEEFSQDDDLLTPTLKKKRRNISDAYEAEIEAIYDGDGGETGRQEAEAADD